MHDFKAIMSDQSKVSITVPTGWMQRNDANARACFAQSRAVAVATRSVLCGSLASGGRTCPRSLTAAIPKMTQISHC